MPGGRLTQQDRHRIATGLADDLSYAEIARRLGRSTSTVSREIARNGGPAGYRSELAHRATERRARRRTPVMRAAKSKQVRAAGLGVEGRAVGDRVVEDRAVELAVGMGLPRMAARVLVALSLSGDGRLTAAELARGLEVSPASISAAVSYLISQGLIQREREPQRRHDVYTFDHDAWYHAAMTGARQTLEAARIAKEGAEALGADTPEGSRLAKGGAFLEQISLDALASVERWRGLLS
ncbi:MAG: helix-turn-helix domain-containing protein [Catenulispora sp.]|nr:helix-turn-helix domain-containing protein [Catenulispora sp.]